LYAAAFTWCGDHLTDGLVTDGTVATLARLYRFKNPEGLVAELVASGLWAAAPGGQAIADFFPHNTTRAARDAARKETRERVKNWREQKRRNAVTPGGAPVHEVPGNAVTREAVTEPQTQTQTQDSYSRRGSTSPDELGRGPDNGFATENEVRDAEALALAEELAE
jgi:hypothetical protein